MKAGFFFLIIVLLFTSINVNAQQRSIKLKQAAIHHMKVGRYGEAINLLNKYISANPRVAQGYNLRGLSYEARSQYKQAVLDFRRALKLDPKNSEIKQNLDRTIKVWYKILRKNIIGYKREIAIDPSNPYNYLEIGKANRWLENWDLAEEWYDKYLKLDPNASPDEIIRYSEILAHNGHIKKGEKILKKWVEKYPDDWRLWSKYGYFNLWLSRYRTARDAFEKSLSFKPFFQEALDGLDIANRHAYVTEYNPRSYEKVYPIDRYYRILKIHPNRNKIRFKLVKALIKAKRIAEAYQQLLILGNSYEGNPEYEKLMKFVTNYRTKTYTKKVDLYKAQLEKNPKNKEAVRNLAKYYDYLEQYDSAMTVLNNYFKLVPNESDPKIRFQYAKEAAWGRNFDLAIKILDGLLKDYPNNLKYQLFRAQISIWTNQDIDIAGKYLDNVLAKEPKNFQALIAKGSYYLLKQKFEGAEEMEKRAAAIKPTDSDVIKLKSNIEFQKMRAHEEKIYAILEQGRELVLRDSCQQALPYYREYLAKAEPNVLILKEYGDVLFCAKHYDEAKQTYQEVLDKGYNYAAALQYAKVSYAMGDSLDALVEFRRLVKKNPDEFEPRLYLGDTFAKVAKYDSARTVYDTLLTHWDLDSAEVALVKQRINWLPVTGIAGIIQTFPSFVGFAPIAAFYTDNLSFKYWKYGGRLDLGVTSFLTLGASFYKTYISANGVNLNPKILASIPFTGLRSFTTFEGNLSLRFGKLFRAGINSGTINSIGAPPIGETNAFIRIEKKDTFSVALNYSNTDASLLLYSPYLIDVRLRSSLYGFRGYYNFTSGLSLSSYFSFIKVSDSNEGNAFWLRIGKNFDKNLTLGYEYYYSNFRFESPLYYSPIGFVSHSLWTNYYVQKTEDLEVKLFGKIGYVPVSSFVLLEGKGEIQYKIFKKLSIAGSLSVGSTSRNETSYRFVSGEFSAYWTIF